MDDPSSNSLSQRQLQFRSEEADEMEHYFGSSLLTESSNRMNIYTGETHLPSLARVDCLDTVVSGDIQATFAPTTLPHIHRDLKSDKMKHESSDFFPVQTLALSTSDKRPFVSPPKYPSYNVRTIVRQENHPMWSPLEVQLQYLYEGSCPKRLQLSQPLTGNSSHVKHFRPSSGCVRCPLAEERTYCAAEEPNSGDATDRPRTLPPPLPTNMKRGETREIRGESLEKRSPVVEASSCVTKWILPPLRPREFATSIQVLLRDECVDRQAVTEEERYEALRTLPMPPHIERGEPHPALVAGSEEIVIMEEIRRRYLLEDESVGFAPIWDLYVYAHRCMVLGTAPLVRFLRCWLWGYRGRKKRQLSQREKLFKQEYVSRSDIMVEWCEAQLKLFAGMVTTQETLFRTCIEALQLHTQYAHGMIHIRMERSIELFSLLYGTVMSRAIVCGRVSGLTLFKQLDLLEQHGRTQLARWVEGERTAIACTMRREELTRFSEGCERQWHINDESNSRTKMEFGLLVMWERCHRRELEIVEACERQLDVEPILQVLLKNIDLVDNDNYSDSCSRSDDSSRGVNDSRDDGGDDDSDGRDNDCYPLAPQMSDFSCSGECEKM